MTAADIALIVGELGPIIKSYVEQTTSALATRNKELELRILELETRPEPILPERGERGEPGQKGETGISLASIVLSAEHRLIAHYSDGRTQDIGPAPRGVPGEKGLTGDRGERGDIGVTGAPGERGEKGEPGEIGPIGPAGPAGTVGAVGPQGEKGERGLMGADGPIGPSGEKGADGPGIVDALIDRHGHLVLTMSDGRTKDIGGVVGKDGAPGLNGKDGINGKDGAQGLHGKDGRDGLDGTDGLSVDDMDLVFDEEKGYVFRLTRGDRTKEYPVPWPWDAQVWQAGKPYRKAASVTWDGHFWIAQSDTSEQPGEGTSAWRLAVRRGKQGKEGKPGKDATAVTRTTNTPPLYGY